MNDTRAFPWVWRAIEAVALAAVLLLLYQARQQANAVEERVQKLDTRLAESAVTSRQTASPAALQLAGDADQEALAQRIVALLRTNASPDPTVAQRAPSQEHEETPTATPETENRVRQAQRIVGEALSRGKLEREDVVKLRELQSQSGSDPRFAAMRNEIIAAINQQKLTPEDVAFVAF
jgi:type II secretory pathway pseudopilin PulG